MSSRITNKETRSGPRFKFVRVVRTKSWITKTTEGAKFAVVGNCTKKFKIRRVMVESRSG